VIINMVEQGKKLFSDFDAGSIYYFADYSITCHMCGKTLYPLRAYVIPVDFYYQLRGMYVRTVIVKLAEEDTLFICSHIRKSIMETVNREGWYITNFTSELPKDLSKVKFMSEGTIHTSEFEFQLMYFCTLAFGMAYDVLCKEAEDEWRYF